MKPNRYRRSLLVGLVLLVGCLVVVQTPGSATAGELADYHYIVLSVDSSDHVEPVFHRRVSIEHPRVSFTDEELAQARMDNLTLPTDKNRSFIVRVLVDNRVVYRDIVPVTRIIRGEFHGEKDGAGTAIEHSRHRLDRTAVAIRVPVVEDGVLEIEGTHRETYHLGAIESDRENLLLGDFDPAATITRDDRIKHLAPSGSPANRVDLLIMGDGYTAAQSAQFTSDATSLENSVLSITPYTEYSNYINTTAFFSASTQSGADHPPYNAGCVSGDPTCCADPAMLSDPLAGTFVSTAFDSLYCTYNIHRLLTADDAKVLAAAAAVPDWDTIFLVVNDTTYGGSGGTISVASTHASAPDVIRHEYGHSFTDLADEYESPYPGFPTCSDISGSACEANVTDVTSRPLIKWGAWIHPTTPVPTPEGSSYGSVVGLFEGARYFNTGMYRPRENCLMRSLGVAFGEVCSQAYVLRLYDGGWGVPASGIDIIEPGSESPPTGTVSTSGSIDLGVTLLEPVGGPSVNVVWRVDGTVQSGQTGPSFTFIPPSAGSFQVSITATDVTSLVHTAMAGSSMTSTRTWTVQTTATDLVFADAFESGNTSTWSSSYP